MLVWLKAAIGGIWGYVGALALGAVIMGGVTKWVLLPGYELRIAQIHRDYSEQKAADVSASLAKLQGFIAAMNSASTEYGDTRAELFKRLDALNRNFRNAIKAAPLPIDCKPDPVRVQALTNAIDAANAAASQHGFGETVRSTPVSTSP